MALHDDHISAQRSALVAQHLVAEMGGECDLRLWNVALLDTLFGHAARVDAADADLLIVVIRDERQLSLDCRTWLLRWLKGKQEDTALLVAALPQPRGGRDANKEFFQRVARVTDKEFFEYAAEIEASTDAEEDFQFLWVM